MHAVVKIGNSQYLVQPGQELLVDRLDKAEGNITFDQVLLIIDGDDIKVGQPLVGSATIEASVLGQSKGDKVRVFKYKAKSRYRKTIGFRHSYTKIKINDISINGKTAKPESKTEPKVAKESQVEAKPKTTRSAKTKKTA